MRAKHIIGNFEVVFEGAQTLLTPQIVLSAAKGNFWGQKLWLSIDGSMVEHLRAACQSEIVRGACSIPEKFIIFTLGISLHHKMKPFTKIDTSGKGGINLLSAVCRVQVHKNENCILLVVCCYPSYIDRG
jgi:hypothetical protein